MINKNKKDSMQDNLDVELRTAEMRILKKKKACTKLIQYDTVLVMALELVFSVLFLGYVGNVVDKIFDISPIGLIVGIITGFIAGIRLMCWNLHVTHDRM